MIRPFRLTDIFTLNRYRHKGLFLDSIPTLTWGRSLVPMGALLSPLSSMTGVFTSMCVKDKDLKQPLVAQVVHVMDSPLARFTFLAPDSAVDSAALPGLLEDLIVRVGGRGAQSLIAEVDEDSQSFEALRKASFSIYARQRIWRLTGGASRQGGPNAWRRSKSRDALAAHALYAGLVPAMVQQVEPPPRGNLSGMVYYERGELLAFADVAQGPKGVWMQPFIHPETERVGELMSQLLGALPKHKSRPVYLGVRSYQSWLENALEELGAQPGPRQAVMVKRTALTQKAAETIKIPALEGGTAEITTPLARAALDREKEASIVSYDKAPNYR